MGSDEYEEDEDEVVIVADSTTKADSFQNIKKQNSLNVPYNFRKKDSLDEHAVDTQGYIAHHDEEDEYDEQFMDGQDGSEIHGSEIRTRGFIKGSIGMDSHNSSNNNQQFSNENYAQDEVILEGGGQNEEEVLDNVVINGNDYVTKQ